VITEEQVRQLLATVQYPGYSRDIVSFGLVKNININDADVIVRLALATRDLSVPKALKENCEATLKNLPNVGKVEVLIDVQAPPAAPSLGAAAIPGIQHVIAVASGKGGVGKSTVAANLAVCLQQLGAETALCDCDMYGPSMGIMFGTNERPSADEENRIIPIERYGLKLMSMGLLVDDTSPVVLRGPMVTRYTQQFLRQVDWGELDFLVLDLPPGTGDIQLTIVQTVALSGAVIVTTPQEVALIDARKAAAMFAKVNVPILGLVENMSYFISPKDHTRYDIFGSGGGQREAERLRIPFLGQIPIDIPTREAADSGRPIAASLEDSPVTLEFMKIARKISSALNLAVNNK
jgi:ATP-binding protein involved in chromosome partitioning